MSRPLLARIHAAALAHNLDGARRRAAGCRIMAVVKANAYGHGLLRAADAMKAADAFAVLEIEGAIRLRETGCGQDIVLLEGVFDASELALVDRHRLTLVVHQTEQLQMLETAGMRRRSRVFLKVNSGMNRLGFALGEVQSALARLQNCAAVSEVVLMTHFANADDERGVAWQLERFQSLSAGRGLPVSMANSAALLRFPETRAGWVRPGLMLYGASPFPDETAEALALQPAMTLESRVIAVQHLEPGDRVGYGGIFTAQTPMRIGIVACGYADGYPRQAPTGTPILVDGKRARTVGRVSMDTLYVDLSAVPGAGIGSRVVLWGRGMPVEEVATAAGTVSYVLLCGLAPRVRTEVADG
jgi:alanine racemase